MLHYQIPMLPAPILAIFSAHLRLLCLFKLTVLVNGTNYEVDLSIPHSHPSGAIGCTYSLVLSAFVSLLM